MVVSREVCKENISLLFQTLSSHRINSVTKTNIIISLGDLIRRYPNVIKPYT